MFGVNFQHSYVVHLLFYFTVCQLCNAYKKDVEDMVAHWCSYALKGTAKDITEETLEQFEKQVRNCAIL